MKCPKCKFGGCDIIHQELEHGPATWEVLYKCLACEHLFMIMSPIEIIKEVK